jgi:hypothetical protein
MPYLITQRVSMQYLPTYSHVSHFSKTQTRIRILTIQRRIRARQEHKARRDLTRLTRPTKRLLRRPVLHLFFVPRVDLDGGVC